MKLFQIALAGVASVLCASLLQTATAASDGTIVFEAAEGKAAAHVVLIAGDEEYRTEETMPMLGKLLSQKHGCKCTVVFSMSADGSYIDPNNQEGLQGLAALDSADLMIIGTRFRRPSKTQSSHITKYINRGRPVIGIRTATHAFTGDGKFGKLAAGKFGLEILGETWVNHHGKHKSQGARSVIEPGQSAHPIFNGVGEIFAPSDVYGVTHLGDKDTILLRAAVTESLNPASANVEGEKNDPMQPFAWLHNYTSPRGTTGKSFCTTGGASVDFLDADLLRLVVNAAYHLTDREVPAKADVDFVDEFNPSFFGFIREKNYWKTQNLQTSDFELGKSTAQPDPKGTPEWRFEAVTADAAN